MHGDTPITSLNNQSKGQKQQTIPVAALADGAQCYLFAVCDYGRNTQ